MDCYYRILGVKFDASIDEIKKAFKSRAIQLHPDKNFCTEESKVQFQNLRKAYECLSNPQV